MYVCMYILLCFHNRSSLFDDIEINHSLLYNECAPSRSRLYRFNNAERLMCLMISHRFTYSFIVSWFFRLPRHCSIIMVRNKHLLANYVQCLFAERFHSIPNGLLQLKRNIKARRHRTCPIIYFIPASINYDPRLVWYITFDSVYFYVVFPTKIHNVIA